MLHFSVFFADMTMASGNQIIVIPEERRENKEIIILEDTYESTILGKCVKIAVVGRQSFLGLELNATQKQALFQHLAGTF